MSNAIKIAINPVAAVGTLLGGGAEVLSIIEQRKARKEQRRQNDISNRLQRVGRVRNIRRSIAAARIRRAEVQSAGFEFGVAGGTAAQGAAFGVTGDLASSIGASNIQITGQQTLADSQNRVSGFEQQAATFGSIANLTSQFGGQEVSAITSLF